MAGAFNVCNPYENTLNPYLFICFNHADMLLMSHIVHNFYYPFKDILSDIGELNWNDVPTIFYALKIVKTTFNFIVFLNCGEKVQKSMKIMG